MPAFVRTVLSVIMKIRDFSLPVMVNVFALSSVAEIVPWNGTARSVALLAAGGAALAETATDVAVLGADEGAVLAAAAPTAGAQSARAAMHAGISFDLFFMGGCFSNSRAPRTAPFDGG
jgi:hypothetical protein